METIRKKICLENSRSRQQGLLPFIPYNTPVDSDNPWMTDPENGNYGGFVRDFSAVTFNSGTTIEWSGNIPYLDVMKRYHRVQEILRGGIRTKKIYTGNNCGGNGLSKYITNYEEHKTKYNFVPAPVETISVINDVSYRKDLSGGYDGDYVIFINDFKEFEQLETSAYTFSKEVERYLGIVEVDDDITGGLVPDFFNLSDIEDWKEWFDEHDWIFENGASANPEYCCTIQELEMRGGERMKEFLDEQKTYEAAAAELLSMSGYVPTVSVPIVLTQSYTDLGLMTAYDDGYPEEFENLEISGRSEEFKTGKITFKDGIAESRLYEVKIPYDDESDDSVLPGLFEPCNEYYRFTYSNGVWSGEVTSITSRMEAADGIPFGTTAQEKDRYRTLTCPAVLEAMNLDVEDGWNTVFLVKYYDKLSIPYKDNAAYSLRAGGATYFGNLMENIEISGDSIEFTYYLGADLSKTASGFTRVTGGVRYVESYPYYPDQKLVTTLDGYENVVLSYDKIDFDSVKQRVYDENLGIYRDVNTADVKFMAGMEEIAQLPVFKEDYLNGISEVPQNEVDITVTKGNAAAWQTHMQLSECNTFEDLENYKNNYYKL